MAQGSGGYGGPNFSQISSDLANIAIQFGSILALQRELGNTITTWRNFQKELVLSNAAAQGTTYEFQQMQEAARNFALASNFAAAQVANSFYNLASAGLSVRETLSAASGVILLSQASLTDLGEAADITASSMAQFNLDATQSTRISNLFVASTNSSLSTVSKLAFALRQVGPVAQQANLSIEQTVGVLDKLFDAGLRGEQAGTALRNILTRLNEPQGRARQVLNSLGIDTVDRETGAVLSRIEIFKKIANKNLSSATLSELSGLEGVAGFITLLNSLKVGLDGTTTELETHIQAISNTNAAYIQAVQQANTLDGALNRASNSFNELRIIVGQSLAPVVASLATDFERLVEVLRNADEQVVFSYIRYALFATGVVIAGKAMLGWTVQLGNTARGLVAYRAAQVAITAAHAEYAAGAITAAEKTAEVGAQTTVARTGLLAMASSAGAMLLLAGALTAVAIAIYKVNQAEDERQRKAVTSNFISASPTTKGLSKDSKALLADNTDYSKGLLQNIVNASQLSPIDETTGIGANDYTKRLIIEFDRATAEAERLKRRADIMRTEYASAQPVIEAAIQELRKTVLPVTAEGYEITVGGGQRSTIEGIVTGLTNIAQSRDEDTKSAILEFYAERIAAVQSSTGIADNQKAQLIKAYKIQADKLTNSGDIVISQFKASLVKPLQDAEKELDNLDLTKNSDRRSAQRVIEKAVHETFTKLARNTSIDEGGLDAVLSDITAQQSVTQRAIQSAKRRIAENDDNVIRELKSNLLSGSNLSDARAKEVAKYLNSLPSGPGTLIQSVMDTARKNKYNMQAPLKQLGDELVKNGKITKDELTAALTAQWTLAFVDELEVNKAIRGQREELLKLAIRQKQLAGENTDAEIDALVSSLRDAAISNAGQGLIDELSKGSQTVKQQLESILTSQDKAPFLDIIQRYADASDADKALLEQRMTELAEKHGNVKLPVFLAKILLDYSNRNKVDNAQAQNIKEEDIRRKTENLKALLQLPSDQQNEYLIQRMETEVSNTIDNYFNVPLIAAQRAYGKRRVDALAKYADLSNKFEQEFINRLSKDVPTIANDVGLQKAFSGDGLREIVEKGSTAFNGGVYTSLDKFIEAVTDHFAEIGAKANLAPERILAANTQLKAMSREMQLTYDQFIQDMRLNYIKDQQAQDAARVWLQNFDLNKIITDFTNAVQAGVVKPEQIEVVLDLAIKARTAKIDIDADDAIAKLRAQYIEMFKQYGIAVYLDAKGNLQLADKAPTPTGAQVASAGGIAPASNIQLSNDINEGMRRAFDYFIGKGLTKNQAAGVVGSLAGESGLNPDAVNNQSGAYGLAQHLGARKTKLFDYLDNKGDPFTGQLDFIWGEFQTTELKAFRQLIKATTAEQAERIHTLMFERPSDTDAEESKGYRQKIARQLAAGSGGTDNVIQPVEAPVANPEAQSIFDAKVAELQKYIKAIDDERARLKAYQTDIGNAFVFALRDTAAAAQIEYDKFQGARDAAVIEIASRAANAAGNNREFTAGQYQNPNVSLEAAAQANRQAIVAQQIANLEQQRLEAIAKENLYYAQQSLDLQAQLQNSVEGSQERRIIEAAIAALAAKHLTAEQAITDEYRNRQALVPNSAETYRANLDDYTKSQQNRYNTVGYDDKNSYIAGLRSGAVEAAKSIQTAFELSTNIAKLGIEGLADAGASLLLGSAKNAKQAVASMLQSIAQLIAKMLIMYATIQLINLIPGGSAVLAALDIGGKALSGAKAVSSVAAATRTAVPFAEGGVGGPLMTRNQMMQGGVRDAFQPAMALFGEGHHKEAFIPMLDGHNVPIMFDSRGNPYIPLPSGQRIPGKVQGGGRVNRFALGGTMGGRSDNVINPANASMADRLLPSGSNDIMVRGGGNRTVNTHETNTYHFDMPVHIHGNVDKETAQGITADMMDNLKRVIDAHMDERDRKNYRNSKTVQGMYGVGQ